jgi:hypothetical protein
LIETLSTNMVSTLKAMSCLFTRDDRDHANQRNCYAIGRPGEVMVEWKTKGRQSERLHDLLLMLVSAFEVKAKRTNWVED